MPKNKRKKSNAKLASKSSPATLERWLQLALAASERGAFSEAISFYTKILKKDSNQASIWHALGGCYFHSAALDDAARAIESALAIEPDNPDYLNDLGGLYLSNGEAERAEGVLRRLLGVTETEAEVKYNLASALYQQKKLAEAIKLLSEIVKTKPNFAEAHFNLGVSLKDLGNLDGARKSFERARSLQPDNPRVDFEIAELNTAQHRLAEAIECYQKYLRAMPEDVAAQVGLAEVLYRNGDGPAALELLRESYPANERPREIAITLATILHNTGELKNAEEVYANVLKRFPEESGAAVGLSRLKRFTDESDPVLAQLMHAWNQAPVDQPRRQAIGFALGKAYDDLGCYEDAFEYYAAGNSLRAKLTPYDSDKAAAEVDRIVSVFDHELLRRYESAASQSQKPVFIVGMPRSGTTLTEQIIASHPQAAGAGELAFFSSLVPQLPGITRSDKPYPECWNREPDFIGALSDEYLKLLERHDGLALRVTDKLPGNYRHIGMIKSLFARAKIIVCERDPRDVALSIYFQFFSEQHDYAWSLPNIAHHYVLYERLIAHWRRLLGNDMLTVPYANLVTDNEATVRQIIDFLELPWDQACLEFHTLERDVRTASNWQVRQPLYRSSLERWRNYSPYLEEFVDALASARARYELPHKFDLV